MKPKFITILTPTYNRAHTLGRLYQSLLRQTFKDFCWMIVDDGSSDHTHELISSFKVEGKIQIEYLTKPNGGKHRALNFGIQKIETFATFIIDSDDWLADDALQIVSTVWNEIPTEQQEYFSGVAGLCAYENNQIIGTDYKFTAPYLDVHPTAYAIQNHIQGDKISFHKTAVLKSNPFPEIEGEKFISESVVWNKISHQYKQRLLNKTLLYKEYLVDGLTAHSLKLRVCNPLGTILVYHSELAYAGFTFKSKVKSMINLNRFMFHAQKWKLVQGFENALTQLFTFLPSYLFYLQDKLRLSRD
jgi:glycosyltransferase involved in cell wall biosynthesis